ncbi:unnamed protein product [Prorocentrum cordatum]|uniref:Polyprenol reductase n=1 Tax=Prorocentrum cordatum TaxID=2364126 RepID=A0ABN9V7Z5_9DINO|nr:unnamed protein product [Polarella glacialis]
MAEGSGGAGPRCRGPAASVSSAGGASASSSDAAVGEGPAKWPKLPGGSGGPRSIGRASEWLGALGERPLTMALHLVAVLLLMWHLVPENGFVPQEPQWAAFPALALAHGSLKLLRLALRCIAFVVPALRPALWQGVSQSPFGTQAWEMVLESGLATIWPTQGLTSVAFISFFLARTFTIPWLWMEAVVGLRVYDGHCGVVAMGQGLFIRSYWAVGSLIGLQYLRGLEAEGRGEPRAPGGGLSLHPRMWRMVQSPFFHRHACTAMLAWLLMSVLECFKLYHWEAGVPASSQELDAFRYTKAFFSQYTKAPRNAHSSSGTCPAWWAGIGARSSISGHVLS